MMPHRFNVYFYVNQENTYILKNVYLSEVWDESIPSEALSNDYGTNRWHVMMKYAVNQKMATLGFGERLLIAYQDYLEGHDNEEIYVTRVK